MNQTEWLSWGAAVFIGLGIAGCSVQQPPSSDEQLAEVLPVETKVAPDYQAAADYAVGQARDGWLKNFNDPRLEALVAEAIAHNLNLQSAASAVDIAAAQAVQAGAELKPVIGAGAKLATAETIGSNTLALDQTAVTVNASWELDLWGRVRSQAAAGEAAFEAAQFQLEWAYQSVAAQTARMYYLLTEAALQLGLAEQVLELYQRTAQVVDKKHQLGQVTEREVSLAKANVAVGEATIRRARGALRQASRGLEVMLGRYPSAEISGATDLEVSLPTIPVGIPSELLERRPDLKSAERVVAAQFYQIQQAEAARLPRISLTGSLGSSSNELANVLSLGNDFWSVGANFAAPIFTGGALEAQVDIESAQYQQALANYGQTALVAFSEVEQGLDNETLLREQQEFLEVVVAESTDALNVATKQFEVGKVDLLSVLQQQGQVIGSQVNLLNIKDNRLQQRIALHLKLGGDFRSTSQ